MNALAVAPPLRPLQVAGGGARAAAGCSGGGFWGKWKANAESNAELNAQVSILSLYVF